MRKCLNTFLDNMAKICVEDIEKKALTSFEGNLKSLQRVLFWDETRNAQISFHSNTDLYDRV